MQLQRKLGTCSCSSKSHALFQESINRNVMLTVLPTMDRCTWQVCVKPSNVHGILCCILLIVVGQPIGVVADSFRLQHLRCS